MLRGGEMNRAMAGGLVLLVLAWAGSALSLNSLDQSKPKGWDQSSLLYVPSGKLLKPMAMDLDEGFAAVMWTKAVLYFSDAYLADQKYEWLSHILEVVTTLNPRFRHAYEFAGTVLGKSREDWPVTRKILEKGRDVFPNDWQLRVYLAIGLVKHDSDYSAAAEVLKPISLLPGIPDHIRTLSATYLDKNGEDNLAMAFLVNRFLSASDPLMQEVFVMRILKFYKGEKTDSNRRKSLIYKLLGLAKSDPRSEALVVVILREYLWGELSPGSKRVLGILGENVLNLP